MRANNRGTVSPPQWSSSPMPVIADRWCRCENLIGQLRKMREVFEVATRVARRDSTVLLAGESGTGNELLAKAIHQYSSWAKKPFVTITCGAIPESLIESELFGHRKGSFNRALADRVGKFETVNEGTIFLDEIGDLAPALQIRLLRVIQEREIDKIGYPQPIKVNVRILAATHRNLPRMVEEGRFREDLSYRVKVVTIDLPPLRDRREDIPLLGDHFLKKHCRRYQMPPVSMSGRGTGDARTVHVAGQCAGVRERDRAVGGAGQRRLRSGGLRASIQQSRSRAANVSTKLPDEGISLIPVTNLYLSIR